MCVCCAAGRYTDALLGSTFGELRRDHMAELPSDALRLPDAASIPSAIAQARREISLTLTLTLPLPLPLTLTLTLTLPYPSP